VQGQVCRDANLRAIAELRTHEVDAPNPIAARREVDLGLTDLEQHVLADLLD
jgi:hypothetical protein